MADNDQSGYDRLRSARWRKSAGRVAWFVGICVVAAIGVRLGIWLGNFQPKPQPLPRGPQMRIKVIDVGAGSSELITIDSGGTLLIDTGPDAPGGDAVAAAVGLGKSINLILLSTTRARCIGGLPELIEHTRIDGPVLLPCSVADFRKHGGSAAADAIEAMHAHGIAAEPYDKYLAAHLSPLGNGCPLQLAGVPLVSKGNHHISLAVRVEYGASALLYAAGLNADEERNLLTRDANLSCDIFAVPDGGSEDTAMPELLALAGPEVAVISSDHDDPPDAITLNWLSAANLKVGRTDTMSTFTLDVDAQPYRAILWKTIQAEARPAAMQ